MLIEILVASSFLDQIERQNLAPSRATRATNLQLPASTSNHHQQARHAVESRESQARRGRRR